MKKQVPARVGFGVTVAILFFLQTSCHKDSAAPQSVTKKWVVSTVAGSDATGFKDGDGDEAQFTNAEAIITDNNGNLYVGDIGNASVRKVTYDGQVTTYAGKNIGNPDPQYGNIFSLALDSHGSLYTIEYGLIRKIRHFLFCPCAFKRRTQ